MCCSALQAQSTPGGAALKQAVVAYQAKDFPTALARSKTAAPLLPKLRDYTSYLEGASWFETGNFEASLTAHQRVIRAVPESPFLAQSVMQAAKALVETQRAAEAIVLLRQHHASLENGQGDLLLAQTSEVLGDKIAAAGYYQNVYYLYPDRPEATLAGEALARLQPELGNDYPPPSAKTLLARAFRLLQVGQAAMARKELEAILPQLGGKDRELAQVRIGVANYRARQNRTTFDYLRTFTPTDPDIDAERLFHVHAAARRLNLDTEALEAVRELAMRHPKSRWRLEALVSAGNDALINNDEEGSLPHYRACFEAFPDEPQAAYCHWKVTWNAYIRRLPTASGLLRAHLRHFPASEKRAAALYFLGRLAEKNGNPGAARAWYSELRAQHPNFYHATLARTRLSELKDAIEDPAVISWLASVPKPPKRSTHEFDANRASQLRIERAKLLSMAELDDWAETELYYGAKHEAQPQVMAMELAELTARMGATDRGIRYLKQLAGGYLSTPLEAAPERFWRLAFPLPFRSAVEKNAGANGLDPFLLAALVRQESEFNPQAVSPARAYGLTQVLPSTGRELSRKLGLGRFHTNVLFEPEVNLKLGTYYFKTLLNSLGGRIEATLASYNGGKSRVLRWLQAANFEEPAEFVESIPFSETRNYVQIVLRNADLYRRLYGRDEGAR